MKQTHRRGCNMTMEAEIGVVHLQVKDCQLSPKLERGIEHTFPRSVLSKRYHTCQHLDFRLLASVYTRLNFCFFKPPSLSLFVIAAPGIQYREKRHLGLGTSQGKGLMVLGCLYCLRQGWTFPSGLPRCTHLCFIWLKH